MNQNVLVKTRLKIKYTYIFFVVLLILIVVSLFVSNSFSEIMENDVPVKADSELTYYLKVSYDGVDKSGVESNDTTVSEIKSGEMYITDKIPDGLTFKGFVTTSDGTIGASTRVGGNTCVGKVIDDTNEASVSEGVWDNDHINYTYHGLHYNDTNRTVSFRVKNLKAGCDLTVGIITQTPATIDDPNTTLVETRRDFYNFASIREKSLLVNSNTVHTFMGNEFATLHNVTYQFTGTVPSGVTPSVTTAYMEGASVLLNAPVNYLGYTFSGWSSEDVSVSNDHFTIPNHDVLFTGSFTEIPKNKVTYTIQGTTPNGYVLPSEKNYYPGSEVFVDGLKSGDIINGYKFLGWNSTDVTVTDNSFSMPSSNVVFTGLFEEVRYKLKYEFYDSILPPNSDSYLPSEVIYNEGDVVTLTPVTNEPTGYKFLGWYSDNSFKMPNHDVVVYGEWMELNGTFSINMSNRVLDNNYQLKNRFSPGEQVIIEVTVTPNHTSNLRDVVLKVENDNTHFISGSEYTVMSEHTAKIDTLNVGSTSKVYLSYTISEDDYASEIDTITNRIKGVSALSNDGYIYDIDSNPHTDASFGLVPKVSICTNGSGISSTKDFQIAIDTDNDTYHFDGDSVNYWLLLKNNNCKDMYLPEGDYYIGEVVPQEYNLSVTGSITNNFSKLTVENGNNYSITFNNSFVRKGFYHSDGSVNNRINGSGGT